MNLLVTGGAGYIGSHAVKQLISLGHRVVVIDNLFRGHREAVPSEVPFHQLDLAETGEIIGVLKEYKVETVMHFAALTYVGESVNKPLWYYRNNTAGALSLLEAMEICGVNRFVFSSTAATYGEPDSVPIKETNRQAPINPYGRSKWFVEGILKDLVIANPKFGFVALRYFNVAGASADGIIGEDHEPETHLVPNVLYAAMGKRDKITVFGNDYPTPDGTCIRDYVHVDDLISAHVLAMNSLRDGDAKFYNLGIGHGYSVGEILNTAKSVTGRDIPTEYGERRAGDPAQLYADSTVAQTELGWKPVHTDVNEVIESAWRWHTSHPNGYGSRRQDV
ncbi:MAG: UDP-glucose 4-epimerase GalE [Planctomycetaceae bacterium]|jgi:UDP-glucose 4-epimerase|nr:UDP-glucose 4-epimerase GalE [Planctomycetaceae bacterium]